MLLISSSDNSDPTANGRVYTATAALAPRWPVPVLAVFCALVFMAAALNRLNQKWGPVPAAQTAPFKPAAHYVSALSFRPLFFKKLFGGMASALNSRLFFMGAAILAVLFCALNLFAPDYDFTLDNLQHDSGHSWVRPAPALPPYLRPFYLYLSDTDANNTASRLTVTENGAPLPFPHSLHADIRGAGAGRFSHYNENLYLSALDNSDPAANGRVYEAKIPLAPRLRLKFLGAFFALSCIAAAICRFRLNRAAGNNTR